MQTKEPFTVETTPSEQSPAAPIRRFHESGGYRWTGVALKEYKQEGSHFQDVTRQILFGEAEGLPSQLRYFEIEAGGHSTLEQHEHVHGVLIMRGAGHVLIDDAVHPIAAFDLVYVPPLTWHQFRATGEVPLGFLCLVDCERDRPLRPDEETARRLRARPTVGDFVRL